VDFKVDPSRVCGLCRQILHCAAIPVPFTNKKQVLEPVLALFGLRFGLQAT